MRLFSREGDSPLLDLRCFAAGKKQPTLPPTTHFPFQNHDILSGHPVYQPIDSWDGCRYHSGHLGNALALCDCVFTTRALVLHHLNQLKMTGYQQLGCMLLSF